MKKIYKVLLSIICLIISLSVLYADVMAEDDKSVYISVERFIIGQGYIVTPKKVTVKGDEKVSEIVEKVLYQEGHRLDVEEDSSYGWYLAGIFNSDSGTTKIPLEIMNLDTYTFQDRYKSGFLPVSENGSYPELAQFSYNNEGTMSSGWFYYVNNIAPGYGMGYYEPEDQDVIRIQFTLCMGDLNKIGNIDSATKSLAILKEYLEKENADTEISSIYSKSLELMSDIDVDRKDIQQLQNNLLQISKDLGDGIRDESYSTELTLIENLYDKTKIQDIETRIDLLPDEISADNGQQIEGVHSLYLKLTANQENQIKTESRERLNSVWEKWCVIRKEMESRKAADTVIAQINAIGTVTMSKEAVITAARKAYNALNPSAKAIVPSTVLSKLTAAEQKILSLKKEQEKKKYTPAKAKITKIISGKKQAKLTWKKIASASGYEIEMSSKKASGFKKIATIKKAKTVTYTKKKLKSGKTMYFRIRAYRSVGKTTYYGAYSTAKKVKIR